MNCSIITKTISYLALVCLMINPLPVSGQETGSFASRIGTVRNIMSAVQSSPDLTKQEKEQAWNQYVAVEEKNEQMTESVEKADREHDQFLESGNKQWDAKQNALMEEAERIGAQIDDHNSRHREFGPHEDAALKRYNAEADRLNKMKDDFIERGEREEQQLAQQLDRQEQQFIQRHQQRMQQFENWVNGNSADSPNAFVMKWGARISLNGKAINQLRILNKQSQTAQGKVDLDEVYQIIRDSFENGRGHYDANVVDLRHLKSGSNVIFPKRK